MSHVQGVRNYSHCPLKKRPLLFVCEDVVNDEDQPQDLSTKRRRHEDDLDISGSPVTSSETKSPPPTIFQPTDPVTPSPAQIPDVSAHPHYVCQSPEQQTPNAATTHPAAHDVPSLADFYLKLFQSQTIHHQHQDQNQYHHHHQQQQQQNQYHQYQYLPRQHHHHHQQQQQDWWQPPATVWPLAPSASCYPSVPASYFPAHPVIASRMCPSSSSFSSSSYPYYTSLSPPLPPEDRLASPRSTASEDSGIGTEASSDDEIDVIGDIDDASEGGGGPSRYAAAGEGRVGGEALQETRYSFGESPNTYLTNSSRYSFGEPSSNPVHSGVSKLKNGSKSFACKHCDKDYRSLGALKMHIRTHTLPCKCTLCGKAFSRPWLLQGHIRTHTGEKPFQCPQCDRCFADRSNLRAHLQTHADVKKYACATCHKTFSRMSLLNKHVEVSCRGKMAAKQEAGKPLMKSVKDEADKQQPTYQASSDLS